MHLRGHRLYRNDEIIELLIAADERTQLLTSMYTNYVRTVFRSVLQKFAVNVIKNRISTHVLGGGKNSKTARERVVRRSGPAR